MLNISGLWSGDALPAIIYVVSIFFGYLLCVEVERVCLVSGCRVGIDVQ